MGPTRWVPPDGSDPKGPTRWVRPEGSHPMGPTRRVPPDGSDPKGPGSHFSDMPNELNITAHQTETVISNSHDFQTEKMSTDLNSMLTKQHTSNGLKRDIPTLTHKQLINAYIEKKADDILIPFTNKIETLIKS